MEEYLVHWWSGEAALYYQPWGLTMLQLNKLINLCQYLTGLLGIFELVQLSTVVRQWQIVSTAYFVLNKLPWALINIPITIVPKLATGLIAVFRGEVSIGDVARSIVIPRLRATVQTAGQEAENHIITRWFQWLANHPLSDTFRRLFIFLSFAVFALLDIFTS